MPTRQQSANPVILVVGDWAVDEYWFVVTHESEISSHTGTNHYRLSNKANEFLSDLCGAGHAFRILDQLREAADNHTVVGVGAWNRTDTEYIRHLIHSRSDGVPECEAAKTCLGVVAQCCEVDPAFELHTLVPEGETTRVVRVYQRAKDGIEQLNRMDWGPDATNGLQTGKIELSDLPKGNDVDAVVVYDLGKGVVTSELIKKLRSRYPKAKWYVRSKVAEPPWLEHVQPTHIELILIGPELATRLNPWDTLLTDNTVTPLAIETASTIAAKHVVLVSAQREVAAFSVGHTNDSCISAKSLVEAPSILQLGWTSALFAGLVDAIYRARYNSFSDAVATAIGVADKYGPLHVPESAGILPWETRSPRVVASSRVDEENRWRSAQNDCGIIQIDGSPQLDVWRASPCLPGYIACVKQKQEIINLIGSELRAFKRSGSRLASVSVLLQADPGSGKTFLARSLAESFGLSFVTRDVSQMVGRDELFDFFDEVATLQAKEQRVLVFVDEINALVQGNHVYGTFLSPLEEGVYIRRGKVFSLKPCAWIFAGTDSSALASNNGLKPEKFTDFMSRLTMSHRMDYQSLKSAYQQTSGEAQLRAESGLEQVYVGATMIHRYFADVQHVSREVLQYFHDVDPEDGSSARKIRKLVSSMKNVQYGRITRENCAHLFTGIGLTSERSELVRLSFN